MLLRSLPGCTGCSDSELAGALHSPNLIVFFPGKQLTPSRFDRSTSRRQPSEGATRGCEFEKQAWKCYSNFYLTEYITECGRKRDETGDTLARSKIRSWDQNFASSLCVCVCARARVSVCLCTFDTKFHSLLFT